MDRKVVGVRWAWQLQANSASTLSYLFNQYWCHYDGSVFTGHGNKDASLQNDFVGEFGGRALQQASPSSNSSQVSVVGYLYDNLCLYMPGGTAIDGTNVTYGVPEHTIECMTQVPECVDSGFVVRQLSAPAGGAYSTAYNLTNSSTPVVMAFLNSLTRPTNAYAKVRWAELESPCHRRSRRIRRCDFFMFTLFMTALPITQL